MDAPGCQYLDFDSIRSTGDLMAKPAVLVAEIALKNDAVTGVRPAMARMTVMG
jgi:hypothetical protein